MSKTGEGKKLGTFNVETELWKAFKNKARANESTASSLLNDWVKEYLGQDIGNKNTGKNIGTVPTSESESAPMDSWSFREMVGELIDERLLVGIEEHLLAERDEIIKLRKEREGLERDRQNLLIQCEELRAIAAGGVGLHHLPDLIELRDKVLSAWQLKNSAESKHRIRTAIDTFIKELESAIDAGEGSYINRLKAEVERVAALYEAEQQNSAQITRRYEDAKRKLKFLGETAW